MKIAVVLFNLGGPLRKQDIKPFLFNFFMDKNIIAAPLPVRYLIAKYISIKRGGGAAKKAYGQLGYKSPLLLNTQMQAQALEKEMGKLFPEVETVSRVFVSMRYWEPTAKDTIDALNDYYPDHLVLLPLYPQYSTTTTNSSLENFWAEVQAGDGALHARWDDETKVHQITCYPLMEGFVKASADLVKKALGESPAGTRVLFSAHGLPEKVVAGGDPYQFQCEKTAEAIAASIGLVREDWRICYQSSIGPLKWIGPSLEEELRRAAQDKKGVVIYPHAFVSEHVETLVELDIDYRKKAADMGVPYYRRVPAVSDHPDFIAGLGALVREVLQDKKQTQPCAKGFSACGCLKEAV